MPRCRDVDDLSGFIRVDFQLQKVRLVAQLVVVVAQLVVRLVVVVVIVTLGTLETERHYGRVWCAAAAAAANVFWAGHHWTGPDGQRESTTTIYPLQQYSTVQYLL